MTDLMQHAINILGVCQDGGFSADDIKPGLTVTKIEWEGCMATDRRVVDIGDVIRHQDHGRYPGVVVGYDRRGERWEPLAHFRRVDDELEVWS